jgi:hypothetical protein
MSKLRNLVAGLAGSIALNLLHEGLRKTSSDVPRVDLLGEDALQKTLKYFGGKMDDKQNLYKATLAGDVLGNTLYYSLIGAGDQKYMWPKAIFMGLTAGIGAVKLPEPMGLDPEPVTKDNQVKVLTVGYYLFGAIVTGLVLNAMKRN